MKTIQFQSEGLTLVGHLYTPARFDQTKTYPAVLVGGSWTTVKEQMQGLYARAFADRGFVALTFDHRYFGESEGQPREYEDPTAKVADFRNAITYLQSLPFVDGEAITGVGICASGAYMLQTAADDGRLKAVATVAAWLMTPETAKLFYGGDKGVRERIRKATTARQRFIDTGLTDYVPAYDPQNMEAAMFFPVDYYARPERGAVPSWRNNFAVMSWANWLTYDGIAAAARVDVPVVLVGSEKQFLPDGVRTAFAHVASSFKKMVWLNQYEHTDFYDNPAAIAQAVDAIEHFLNTVLEPETAYEP